MKFVRTDDLKAGMRLAKPIYNKNGVLLYERNTLLTDPGIRSIKNFSLIGIFILEPAEPLPPLTKEDLAFEQSQTIYMFKLRECYAYLQKRTKLDTLPDFIMDIVKRFGSLDHRVNFNQNLRSSDDYMYKHAISIAILTAMIAHEMGLSILNQKSLIAASLLFNFGYTFVPYTITGKGNLLEQGDIDIIQQSLEKGFQYFEKYSHDFDFMPDAYSIMEYYIHRDKQNNIFEHLDEELIILADILKVADKFDTLTCMNLGHEPESEIMAMQYLIENSEEYNKDVVSALAQCIHIVPAGASVDLSTGDKGIVLVENPSNYMRPLILRLSNNQLYDLSADHVYSHMKIIDIMKTMDNRIEIDEETLKHFVADDRIKKITKKFRKALYNK